MTKHKNPAGDGGPSQGTWSKKGAATHERSPSLEVVKSDQPPPTSEQLRNAEMESKFQEMTTKSLAEAMPAIIRGAAEALKADQKFEEESSKHSRSRKPVEKPKPRDKAQSDSDSSFHDSKDSGYHSSSPSSENSSDNLIGRNIGKPSLINLIPNHVPIVTSCLVSLKCSRVINRY
jgi:hypothetical protein